MQESLLTRFSRNEHSSNSNEEISSSSKPTHEIEIEQQSSSPHTVAKNRSWTNLRIKKGHHYSAPSIFRNDMGPLYRVPPDHKHKPASLIVKLSPIILFLYVAIGVTIYIISGSFKGTTTFKFVDAVYFTVVTLSTIGYGDIVPDTTFTKIFTCGYILVGFGLISFMLNELIEHICNTQETLFLSMMDEDGCKEIMRTYTVDEDKRTLRIRFKVSAALASVIACIVIVIVAIHYVEDLNWVDSFYLSIISVMTVGYGDYSFTTLIGRCFATLWLLVSTCIVAKSLIYLTDCIFKKKRREMVKRILQKKITMSDLVAADIDNDGSISKSEFVLFKLKEMGKITDIDIQQICKQHAPFDHGMNGKITQADL